MLLLAAAVHAEAEADAEPGYGHHGYGYGRGYGYGHHGYHGHHQAKTVAVAPKCTTVYDAVTRNVCSTVHEKVCNTETITNFV